MADYQLFDAFPQYDDPKWDMAKQYPVDSWDYINFDSVNPIDTWLDPYSLSDEPSKQSWDASVNPPADTTFLNTYGSPLSPPLSQSTASPFQSPILKAESPVLPEAYPPVQSPTPKRRKTASPTPRNASKPANKPTPRERIPHNEVERKYREGLNQGMERLRRVLPNLPQSNDRFSFDAAKVSKLVVLASAVDYLQEVEGQIKGLQEENQMLRAQLAERRR
ncbi:hypothetical protein P152DRAFT_239873 [Eremomyces bilateralis CBS 781.70]|uniref:BHLH domain-containing protein n=1 Tax=Eremomyces bilateralis CBS 781.70 TaxID=1392243 RepID=A0A6G1GAB9_9PEZI|nr:uncharacterized protein P152DRAFT_239873 [Eremomyces bilateralis CBS 781.70]KAF1814952.1 hypothetical protein P152DRAFT_239873 [Eremomyces bilateralis CBS 781.70]